MKKILSISLLALILSSLVACSQTEPNVPAGNYQGEATGYNQDSKIKVDVRIDEEGKIAEIKASHEDTDEIAGPCIDQLTKDVIESNSTDVDIVAGATQTSKGFLEAVGQAIRK